jgi:sterol O-acyltransferase
MTLSIEQHPPLPANNIALEDACRLVGQLEPDGYIGSLKPDPFLNMDNTSGSKDRNDTPFTRKVSSRDSGSSSATEFSDTTSDEGYNRLKVDSPAILAGAKGSGYLSREDQTWNEKQFERHYEGVKGRSPEKTSEIKMERRQSFSVKLEKTDKTGRYLLTSDDPELRELLAIVAERATGDGKKGRAKFSDLIFTRRFTVFDRQNPASATSPFHGFFTLFWLGVFMFILKVAGENWRTYGSAFGRNEILHMMFSREVMVLGATDGIMCASAVMGLLLQKAVAQGWIRWNGAGWVIQNVGDFPC